MKMVPKARTIYDNYDLWEQYPDDDIKETILASDWVENESEITDEMIMNLRYDEDDVNWRCQKMELKKFFKGKTVGFFGDVGRWDGVYKAGKIGEFWDLFYKAIEDCAYIRIYDENGHMYLTCSHHDGTCHFEIKEITDKGTEYLDRWEYGTDNRTEQYVHNQIFKRYSKVPRIAQKVYGCRAREYEPVSKGRLIDMVNNQAKSFYS